MKRPDWLTPAHEEAVIFLLVTFAGGFAAPPSSARSSTGGCGMADDDDARYVAYYDACELLVYAALLRDYDLARRAQQRADEAIRGPGVRAETDDDG